MHTCLLHLRGRHHQILRSERQRDQEVKGLGSSIAPPQFKVVLTLVIQIRHLVQISNIAD